MPGALPIPVRQALWRRWQRGQSATTMAEDLHIPVRTVYSLLRRFRRGGADAVAPSYPSSPPPANPLPQAALRLRQQHPSWGAGFILVNLANQDWEAPLPTPRTLQRWFRHAGLGPAPRGRRPPTEPRPSRATRPHDVWQMDAVDRVALAHGQRVCWLRITDEASGAILWTRVFSRGAWGAGRRGRRPGGITAGLSALGPAQAAT